MINNIEAWFFRQLYTKVICESKEFALYIFVVFLFVDIWFKKADLKGASQFDYSGGVFVLYYDIRSCTMQYIRICLLSSFEQYHCVSRAFDINVQSYKLWLEGLKMVSKCL